MKHLTTFSNNKRISTQALLQQVYSAMQAGETEFEIDASGQHDIGGPLWDSEGRSLKFLVRNPGQRVGSMGMPGTEIVVEGPASADVGWLNAGATITVRGDGGDTTGHCAADGVIYIGGRAGTRSGSLMKHDPAYDAPQLWILKSTGSFSFEFMGGGIAVVCGHDCDDLSSVIGDRACIGMVGGVVYVRGPVDGLSTNVRVEEELSEEDWDFLCAGLPKFLQAVERLDLYDRLLVQSDWRKIVAVRPPNGGSYGEAKPKARRTLQQFHAERWIQGGLFGDVVIDAGSVVPLVARGAYRAYSPVWNNAVFAAPCEYACPSGIPTQDRINLLRKGRIREALELVLQYSPFPGSVCGAACPNPCMTACTRQTIDFAVLAGPLGKASMDLPAPRPAPSTGKKFAVIGSGVGGLSAAWQLALKGHEVTIFERGVALGGKMARAIPHDRLSNEIVGNEIQRILNLGVKVQYNYEVTREKFEQIRSEYDGVVVAIGAHNPRSLPFKGSETTMSALAFLTSANAGQSLVNPKGKSVVVVGAGDVGMDVCSTAWRMGAVRVTAVDIREPASASRERESATALGTKIVWPRVVKAFEDGHLFFEEGEPMPADIVIVSIGETPASTWLPEDIKRVKNFWIATNDKWQTSDPKIYAIGDVVKPGLLTEAIGAGRVAGLALHAQVSGVRFELPKKQAIPKDRLKLIYFTPRLNQCPTDRARAGATACSARRCRRR